MNFNEKVWEKCSLVPKGRVTTYKEIASSLKKKAYRAVGTALKNNPYAPKVPCHRVVNSDGSLGGYQGKLNSKKKIEMLKAEKIKIKDGKVVDFSMVLYKLN
jgi:methylated-DNA-[protein]-cysteine S-methyltransferase